jgi:hypothetical protein
MDIVGEILAGRGLTPAQVAERVASLRGKRPATATIVRWMQHGKRSADGTMVRLEHWRNGQYGWVTTEAALREFLERLGGNRSSAEAGIATCL